MFFFLVDFIVVTGMYSLMGSIYFQRKAKWYEAQPEKVNFERNSSKAHNAPHGVLTESQNDLLQF